VKFELLVI